MIDKVIAAKSRDELETAARALDRVLRAGHYWVPHWYKASNNIAYWDKFSRPETKPRFDRGVLDTWWYDTGKAAKLASAAPGAAPAPPAAAAAESEVVKEGEEAANSPRVGLFFGLLLIVAFAAYVIVARLRRKS